MRTKDFFVFLSLTTPFFLHAELVELIKINSTFVLDIRYATTNNFTGKKVYPSAHCFLQEPAAKALNLVQKDLAKKGLGLKIWDGYRPLSVQKIFWKICSNPKYVANPAKGSKHNRGCAVDCTIIELKTGKELAMPSLFDEFSIRANRRYEKMAPQARRNCQALEEIMKKYGFKGESSEWWHYDFVGIGTKKGSEAWRQFPISDDPIK